MKGKQWMLLVLKDGKIKENFLSYSEKSLKEIDGGSSG